VIGAFGRIMTAGALILVVTVLTNSATKWVTGPGTRAPENPYRYPLFDFNQREGFDYDGNFYALVSGWQGQEPWGFWSNGARAIVAFRLPDGVPVGSKSKLILHLKANLTPQLTVQHFSVWKDKTKLDEATVVTSDATIAIPLYGVTLPGDPTPVMLRFEMPDAIIEAQRSGTDRVLSIGLVSLEITR
jgi:hypothetical protein